MIRQIVATVIADDSNRRIVAVEPEKPKRAAKKSDGADGEAKPKKPRAPRITKLEQVGCPVCGTGHLLKGRAAFGCSNYASGCTFRLPFDDCPPDTTPAQINKKINGKKK